MAQDHATGDNCAFVGGGVRGGAVCRCVGAGCLSEDCRPGFEDGECCGGLGRDGLRVAGSDFGSRVVIFTLPWIRGGASTSSAVRMQQGPRGLGGFDTVDSDAAPTRCKAVDWFVVLVVVGGWRVQG